MSKIIEHVILAATAAAFVYFVRWTWCDVKREKRPEVTSEMLDQAYIDMLENSEFYVDDD